MAEKWYAVCDKATGRALSFGSVITSPLAPENEAIELPGQPDFSKVQWDETTRSLVPRPPVTPPETLEQKITRLETIVQKIAVKVGAV